MPGFIFLVEKQVPVNTFLRYMPRFIFWVKNSYLEVLVPDIIYTLLYINKLISLTLSSLSPGYVFLMRNTFVYFLLAATMT